MDPSQASSQSSHAPLNGTLPPVTDGDALGVDSSELFLAQRKALKEAILNGDSLSQAQSSELYKLDQLNHFFFEVLESSSLQKGLDSGVLEAFHIIINNAIERSRREVGLPRDVLVSEGTLAILVAYPEHADDALDILSAIGATIVESRGQFSREEGQVFLSSLFAEEGDSEAGRHRYPEVVSELVFMMTLDAVNQGQPLRAAHFWHGSSYRFVPPTELMSELVSLSANEAVSATREWFARTKNSVSFWIELYSGLRDSALPGTMPELFRDVREKLEHNFRSEWLAERNVQSVAVWSSLLKDPVLTPSATSVAAALEHLLPAKAPDPNQLEDSCLSKFSRVMSATKAAEWTTVIPLPWAAALYRVYFDLQRGQKVNNAPFLQMLLSSHHYPDNWEEVRPQFFSILNDNDPVSRLRRCEDEIRVELNKLRPPHATDDPITILLTAKILGFSKSDFELRHPLGDILSAFSHNVALNKVSPLEPEWVEHSGSIPRVKRLKESTLVERLGEIANRRNDESIRYGHLERDAKRGRIVSSSEEACFMDSPFAVLLGEMRANTRYLMKLWHLGEEIRTREAILTLVELLAEVCNGGAFNDIKCVQDPAFLTVLREDLELESLIQGVREEFLSHEMPTNLTAHKLEVAFKPTRGVLTEFVGHLCDTCFSRVPEFAKNAPWATFVPFVKNPNARGKDGVHPSFAGGSLVIETDALDDAGCLSRVFLIRGYNPSNSLLKSVHTPALFDEFSRYLVGIAKARGVSHILVPEDSSWGLAFTNRPYAFLDVEQRFYAAPQVPRMQIADPERVALNGLLVERGVVVATTR